MMPANYSNLLNILWYWTPWFVKKLLSQLDSSALGKRLARGAFWALVGTFGARGLNMLSMVFVARILGRDEFGELGIIQSTMGMFQTLAGFGLGWAATKFVAEFRNNDPAKAGRIIAFCNLAAAVTGGIMALIFFVVAPWLAQNMLAAPHLIHPLQISGLILLISTIAGTQIGILAGFEAFRSIAQIALVSGVFSIPLVVGGVWFGDVKGAIWGMIASYLLNWLLNQFKLRQVVKSSGIKISWINCWQENQVLWHFSLPAILGGTAFNTANWLCAAMLVNRPNGYGEMGYYNAANQWFSALLFLPGVLGQAAIPVLSERIGEKDLARSRKILLYSCKLNSVVMVPLVFVGFLSSPWIMNLYGNDFEEAWATLAVTLVAAGIAAMQAPAAQVITASGRMWMTAAMNLSWATAFILFSFMMINLNSLGLAISRSIAYCLYAAWSFKFAFLLLKQPSPESA